MFISGVNGVSPVSLTPANNLSAVSLTPTENLRLFGYFPVTSINRRINFSLVSLTPLNSLSPVSNIHSRISPRIFEKIQNGPNGILGGLGDTDS
jgi:hypothetical protein